MAVDADPVFYPIDAGEGTNTSTGARANDGSAAAIIEGTLTAWGLGGLGEWAWKRWLAGDEIDEILLKMRELPVYKDRFPAMAALSAKGMAIDEGQYIAYERAVEASSRKYGIPDGIYTSRQAIADLMVKGYAPTEIEDNMARAAGIIYGQPEVRAAFAQFYGAQGDGAAIAFFLDPEAAIPELEKKYAAAQIAGNALAQGLDVGQADAERLAGIATPSEQEAQRAAVIAASQRELYANLLGERGQVTATQGVSAALGADAGDIQAIEKRRGERKAQYEGGGGIAATSTGVSGLGSANT